MKEGLKDIMAQAYGSTAKSGKLFFPERFSRPWTSIHRKTFDMIDRGPEHPDYNPRKLIVLPRGMGKTSIANLLVPAKKALFQESSYIVPVSASATLAQQQSENLKYKLNHNKVIKNLFGNLKTKVHNKEQWVIRVGGDAEDEEAEEICVMPRGAGQQVRGLLFRDSRPDLFVVDDLEDPDNIDSPDQRKKKKEWFFGDLMQAVDNYAPPGTWEIIVVGTVLHQDSLITNLMESPHWDTLEFAICDEERNSNIPEWVSDEWVENKYQELKDEGEVNTFYREYMNMASPGGEDSKFQDEMFRYYDPNKINLDAKQSIENVILVDIARTTNPESAESAVVGCALDFENWEKPAIYVRDVVAGKMHPDELYDAIFDMGDRINARVLGVEVTGLHEFITYPIKNEMIKRNSRMDLIELHARGGRSEKGKIERIGALVPFYRTGRVFHNKSATKALETQLLTYPTPKRFDIMDALSYIVELLEKGERYMMPPKDQNVDPKDVVEDEFRELESEYMDPPLDRFRVV